MFFILGKAGPSKWILLIYHVMQARVMSGEEDAVLSKPPKNHRLRFSWGSPKIYTRSWRKCICMSCVWSYPFLLGFHAWRYQVLYSFSNLKVINPPNPLPLELGLRALKTLCSFFSKMITSMVFFIDFYKVVITKLQWKHIWDNSDTHWSSSMALPKFYLLVLDNSSKENLKLSPLRNPGSFSNKTRVRVSDVN